MKTASIKVGNRRLLKLAAFLEKLPRKRFDYSDFVGSDWEGKKDLSCGTTACAIGWACVMPEFKRLGLGLVKTRGVGIPGDGRRRGMRGAGRTLFGLSLAEWKYLFAPWDLYDYYDDTGLVLPFDLDEHSSSKRVARHIRSFVAKREKELKATIR